MQMTKKYIVNLSDEEIVKLEKMLTNGGLPAKHHKFAKILLTIDESKGRRIADFKAQLTTGVSDSTIARVRKNYAEGGLEKVFEKKFTPRPSRRKFDGEKEAHLIALCCSKAPKGYSNWTLSLLSDKVVELGIVESVGKETIRETLKKTKLNLGKK
jgi:transposase